MNVQFALTVPEGKALIAEGVILLPEVKRALGSGKILLKGGTTVSAISEKLVNQKLRLSGRISPKGAKSCFKSIAAPHSILIEAGKIIEVDELLDDTVQNMGCNDLCIISANAIDSQGGAAMMAGAPLGGMPGRVISGLMAEGVDILIAVGLEKLIPGTIADAIKKAGRKRADMALGMSIGLIPLVGRLFTELEAIKAISGMDAFVIGRGGISGAEGATVFTVDGPTEKCIKLMDFIKEIKSQKLNSVAGDSLKECVPGSPGCSNHLACIYREGSL